VNPPKLTILAADTDAALAAVEGLDFAADDVRRLRGTLLE